MIKYRTMKSGDIPAGLELCRKAGWNQVKQDWHFFLKLNPKGCRVATCQDQIVGTVATVKYQNSFSWIGMVLVDPMYQRQGIGMKLLTEALHILKDEQSVKLDATLGGRDVYLKLDFVDEYHLSRMNMVVNEDKLDASTASSVRKQDLPSLIEFDSKIFGASRKPLLQRMWEEAPQYAFLVKDENEIRGFCFGRHGYDFRHIGPIVAQNINIAKNLILGALHNCVGQPVILDALHFEAEWIKWLSSIGFKKQRPFIRMYRGSNSFQCIPENQFAILGPEFG